MEEFSQTSLNSVKRLPKRASYDQQTIHSILDAAMFCHVAFVEEGQPFNIPILHARQGIKLILHGSSSSRLMQHIKKENPVCVAVTVLDGLVLARAAFDHSVNYRSAVLFCRGRIVDKPDEKLEALRLFTEKLMPGRWEDVRPPNTNELKATLVASLDIESASAKVRQGMPVDSDEDMSLPVWAGIIPVNQNFLQPQVDPASQTPIPVPDYLQKWWDELNTPV